MATEFGARVFKLKLSDKKLGSQLLVREFLVEKAVLS
jgi:hypothetical protein